MKNAIKVMLIMLVASSALAACKSKHETKDKNKAESVNPNKIESKQALVSSQLNNMLLKVFLSLLLILKSSTITKFVKKINR